METVFDHKGLRNSGNVSDQPKYYSPNLYVDEAVNPLVVKILDEF